MNISHPIDPQIFPISLSKLGHNINHHKSPKYHILFNFIFIILAEPKTGPFNPMHTSQSFLSPRLLMLDDISKAHDSSP